MKKKTGLKSRGYVKVLVNIPVEHHALMKVKNDECGGKSAGIEVDLVESKAGIRYRVPKDHAACKKSILSLSLSSSLITA